MFFQFCPFGSAIIGVIIDENVKNPFGILNLISKRENGGVLGSDFAGDFLLDVLEIENLLELGNGLEELGLEGSEEGKDFFGGGRRRVRKMRRSGLGR